MSLVRGWDWKTGRWELRLLLRPRCQVPQKLLSTILVPSLEVRASVCDWGSEVLSDLPKVIS